MCFFCNKKTIFLYEFVFFLPKTNLWTKNYFCFYICDCVTRIGGHNTRSWQLAHLGDSAWQDVHRAKHNVCASFCDLFSPAICIKHRIAVIMMRASWFDCDIVRNILRIAHPLDQKMDVLLSILNGQEMQEGDWIRSEGTTEGRKPFSRQRKARTRSWHEGH